MGLTQKGEAYADFVVGRYDAAIENFGKLIHANPDDWKLYFVMGQIYIKKNDFKLAIDYFQKGKNIEGSDIKKLNINLIHCCNMLGSKYYNVCKFDSSAFYYNKAFELKKISENN